MEHKMKRTVKIALVLGAISALGLSACETGPVETSTANLVWPAAPDQPRIEYLTSWSSNAFTIDENKLVNALLGEAEDIKALKKPYGVHVDKSGRIFVTDTRLGKLIVFDEENRRFDVWGMKARGALVNPIGVSSDDQGRIYVSDIGRARVVIFDSKGDYAGAIEGEGVFEGPSGIAVSSKLGKVFVADTKRHVIEVFDLDGNPIATIGKRGAGEAEFNYPTNVTVDDDDRLYVTATLNFRVQVLEADGTFIKEFGGVGDSLGKLSRPKGIAVDSDKNIFVVDASFANFQIFNQDGELLLFVGEAGREAGQFSLPAGAYIDHRDRLYVVDQLNARVQVFQILTEGHVAKSGS